MNDYQQELNYAADNCCTYLDLAIDSIKEYREFEDLVSDLKNLLEVAKEMKGVCLYGN